MSPNTRLHHDVFRCSPLLIAWLAVVLFPCLLSAQELEKQATWQPPSNEQITKWISEWATAAGTEAKSVVDELDSRINQQPDQVLGLSQELLSSWFPFTAGTVDALTSGPNDTSDWKTIISADVMHDPRLPESAATQLKLAAGCWFARHERYDEALELLQDLQVEQVVAPDQLLFYLGMAQHRLLQTEACAATLKKLLEQENRIPRRFAVIAKLMIADIASLEANSLDEIARRMEDIRRRQALHRSGTRVLDQEKKVIELLDQMIEELENQMQQSQASSSSEGSAQPMEGESQNAGGLGKGNVTDKQLQEGGEWGSMPPKKRASVLAEMARDLPPHYREVIEEYFRQLAREPGKK